MIEVQGLVKRYGAYTAVDGLSFTASKGEIVGLLGPNGAGKTTTMRILTGFMPPTEGSVKVCGYDVQEDSIEVRRRVGYMPERVPFYPDMTVEAFIRFWARLRGTPNAPRATAEVLDRFELTGRRKQLIRHLSKGLKQRLGLAQALVHQPEVVILDEPTIGIDPVQVIEVRETVQRLKDQHTVLFSSHILSEVEQVCDRVIIINKGRIVGEGTPEALAKRFAQTQQVFIVVQGAAPSAIIGKLKHLPKITDVRPMDAGYLVSSSDTADIRPALSRFIASEGLTLLEMRPVDASLEDVFLSLIEGAQR